MAKSNDTRQLIIEKTADIFNKKGYTGTTVSDLTEAVGLTKGAIYGNFEDKNEVAVEAFRYNFQLMQNNIRERIESCDSATEKLFAYIEFYREEHDSLFNKGGCPIMNTAIDADDGNPELKNAAADAFESWKDSIQYLVTKGIEENEFKLVDPSKFAHRMISAIEGALVMSKTLDDTSILIDVLDKIGSDIYGLRKN